MANVGIGTNRLVVDLINYVDIDPIASQPMTIKSRATYNSSKKPDHPGQLFYRDFFKLQPNTELVVHYGDNTMNAQFIAITKRTTLSYWNITYRLENGREETESLHYFGAVKSRHGTWAVDRWITLKEST